MHQIEGVSPSDVQLYLHTGWLCRCTGHGSIEWLYILQTQPAKVCFLLAWLILIKNDLLTDIEIMFFFQTDRYGQTVYTQIKVVLKEQANLGHHCLQFCFHCLDTLLYRELIKPHCYAPNFELGPSYLVNWLWMRCRFHS